MTFWRKSKRKDDLRSLRESEDWDALEILHFRDLDLIQIEDNIEAFRRKKRVTREQAEALPGYARAFVDGHGRLRRLDAVGRGLIPRETYIQYEADRPVRAITFWLGLSYHGKQVSGEGEIADEWLFRYDSSGHLVELVCHTHPDLQHRYRLVNEQFRHRGYEYDGAGLLRIYQWSHGLSTAGENWVQEKVAVYDRRRNEIPLGHTVSRTALVSSAKAKKPAATFRFGGPPPREVEVPACPRCDRQAAYLGHARLSPPLKNQSQLDTAHLFFCFNCLESISYRSQLAQTAKDGPAAEPEAGFPDRKIPLSRSSEPEEEADAFVKVGGTPDWIQGDEHPSCPECGRFMMFVAQLNSDEQLSNGRSALMFGDSGRLYTFVSCQTVTNIMQCY